MMPRASTSLARAAQVRIDSMHPHPQRAPHDATRIAHAASQSFRVTFDKRLKGLLFDALDVDHVLARDVLVRRGRRSRVSAFVDALVCRCSLTKKKCSRSMHPSRR